MSRDRPVKRAVSFVVLREAEDAPAPRLLAVRRPPDDEDLPGAWGLPAASLRAGETWEEAVARAGRGKLGLELEVGEPLREGELDREAYRLRMRLYRAEIRSGEPDVDQPAEGVTRYVDWAWARPERLESAAARGSLCSRLCLAWLADRRAPGRPRGGGGPGASAGEAR